MNKSGIVKLVNVVPEFGQLSCDLTSELTDRGISVGAGHPLATADQVSAAIDAGLKYAIHFLNGPTGSSFKPFCGGGAVEGILSDFRIYTELIPDGAHVDKRYLRDTIARKGTDRVIAITDALFASQADGITDFTLGGIDGALSDDRKYAYVKNGLHPPTLFSSALTMDKAFAEILSLLTREMPGILHREHKAMGFHDALPMASRMCTTNAHDMLRMHGCEDTQTGSLEDGNWADLIILDIHGKPGHYSVEIDSVYVRGNLVFTT